MCLVGSSEKQMLRGGLKGTQGKCYVKGNREGASEGWENCLTLREADDNKVGCMHPTCQCSLRKVQRSCQEVLKPKSPRKESRISQEYVCLIPNTPGHWWAAPGKCGLSTDVAGDFKARPLDPQPISCLSSWSARHSLQAATVDKNPATVQSPKNITNRTTM